MRSAQGAVTAEDYLHAQRLHRRRIESWLYGGCVLTALCGGLLLWQFPDAMLAGGMLVGGGTCGLVGEVAVSRLYLPWKVRRLHKQMKAFAHPLVYEWDETTLRASSPQAQGERPWSDFLKYREDDRIFLLYHADNLFEMLPKRWFAAAQQIEDFRQRLARVRRA